MNNKSVLVAVSSAGTLKDYCLDNFVKMSKKCIEPVENVEIMVYGDKQIADYPFHFCEIGGNKWADDVIWETHQAAFDTARNYNFDAVVFQGLDCFYKTEDDFRRLIAHEEDIVGAITMGRKAPDYPVVRKWLAKSHFGPNGFGVGGVIDPDSTPKLSTRQVDVLIPGAVVPMKNGLIRCGFPGTEACLINKQCFNIPIKNPKYKMWYAGTEKQYLCVHEYWMLTAARQGFEIYVDTSIPTWHSDDSGWAHMWRQESKKNNDLKW